MKEHHEVEEPNTIRKERKIEERKKERREDERTGGGKET